jgi:(p)ppGpp synthase/HD superfamily hydrolase
MNQIDPESLHRAMRFAARAHEGQVMRGGRIPYMVHAALVAMEVMIALSGDEGKGADAHLAVVCAILHDVMEDSGTGYENIALEFGASVADGVLALPKNSVLATKDRMADSSSRIETPPREIWMVKLADRIVNLAPPPPDWRKEKIQQYGEEALMILERLGAASVSLSSRLREKIDEYAKYEKSGK